MVTPRRIFADGTRRSPSAGNGTMVSDDVIVASRGLLLSSDVSGLALSEVVGDGDRSGSVKMSVVFHQRVALK